MYTTKQKGFTIVELLIVIVVIAILAAISIVAFTGIQQRGRDSQRASDVSNIVKALTAYTSDDSEGGGSSGVWPANGDAKGALEGYKAANLSSEITNKISTVEPSATSDVYQYELCSSNSGATITYWKESKSGPDKKETVTAGSC
ncbi:type II secretion system protein [Candidatus Saccharibacteria bacterium]|jgi:prepilin-type N-terminal cleavage/methylation domain-containing protein|nr:type II secretion system protein [Candidatus Saccharibacteria bacterium]